MKKAYFSPNCRRNSSPAPRSSGVSAVAASERVATGNDESLRAEFDGCRTYHAFGIGRDMAVDPRDRIGTIEVPTGRDGVGQSRGGRGSHRCGERKFRGSAQTGVTLGGRFAVVEIGVVHAHADEGPELRIFAQKIVFEQDRRRQPPGRRYDLA